MPDHNGADTTYPTSDEGADLRDGLVNGLGGLCRSFDNILGKNLRGRGSRGRDRSRGSRRGC